jgi:hypothetical protein
MSNDLVPANGGNLPSVPGGAGGGLDGYLSEFGVGPTGAIVKFGKDGSFKKTLDDSLVPDGTEGVAIVDQTQAGWIRFNGKGQPPDRRMGPIAQGFVPPKREELGDTDESQWEVGLDGKPADPWQHQLVLPILTRDDEMLLFTTTSLTGRRAVQLVLQHYARMQKRDPGFYPVIQLKVSGFQHRDDRIGWVKTPAFAIVGKAKAGAAKKVDLPDDAGDEIPF